MSAVLREGMQGFSFSLARPAPSAAWYRDPALHSRAWGRV